MRPFSISIVLFSILVLAGSFALAVDSGAPASQPAVKTGATAKDAPEAPANVVDGVKGVVALFKAQEWRPAIAALVMLLVFVWRRFLGVLIIKKIPAKHMAWVTALVGLLAALPAHLAAEQFSIWKFLLDGFITGAEAAILWSMLGKHLLPKIFGEVKENG